MKLNFTVEIDDEELKGFFGRDADQKMDSYISRYARFFDEACKDWTKDPEYNLVFLRTQQDYANAFLKKRGYLFLNDVYKLLDIPITSAGQMVGWVYDEKKPIGDNYVDFGIYSERNSNFVNGFATTCLLDFNVDGVILNYI